MLHHEFSGRLPPKAIDCDVKASENGYDLLLFDPRSAAPNVFVLPCCAAGLTATVRGTNAVV